MADGGCWCSCGGSVGWLGLLPVLGVLVLTLMTTHAYSPHDTPRARRLITKAAAIRAPDPFVSEPRIAHGCLLLAPRYTDPTYVQYRSPIDAWWEGAVQARG